jgi:hypothetical protein
MRLRDLEKMNKPNDGTRTLFESIAIPEVGAALRDWIREGVSSGVLIGGIAVGYYARPRGTTDVDVLFLSNADIPNELAKFKRTRPGAFQHKPTHVEVEVVTPAAINLSMELAQKVFETALVSDGVRVASPTGLVALKLQRMKRYDEGDIVALLETGQVNLEGWPISAAQLEVFKSIIARNQNVEPEANSQTA